MDAELNGVELRSLITDEGKLIISLDPVTIGKPGPGEIVVRVEAAPINPSDLGLMFGPADVMSLKAGGTPDCPRLEADLATSRLPLVKARIGQAQPVGNEGAGTVVQAGAGAEQLMGRTVAMVGGGMYATYRKIAAKDAIALPEGATAAEGAALFVNPLTALGFVETMRAEGHSAIVHTAAASNLGQMLVRICRDDAVPLVNIVRSEAQAELLRQIGADHIVDSSAPDFRGKLVQAIAATGATIGFDAIGGGEMAGEILNAMEAVAQKDLAEYSRYGSEVMKQVYVYGMLDPAPITLVRRFGFTWNVGGWLLFPFLKKAGPEILARMRRRVVEERNTTFASHYTATISLADALNPEIASAYERKATGQKYLIDPNR
ncbi:MAG: NADH oxidase [Sphingobium sp.]